MMTDPRAACANEQQRLLWALVHDALAHPLMALTGYSKLSLRFHDWTSHKAWPRKPKQWKWPVLHTQRRQEMEEMAMQLRSIGAPFVVTAAPGFTGVCGNTIHYHYTIERI